MSQDPLFTPSFDNVLGGMHGYDAENPEVTEENLKALMTWMFDDDLLELEGATTNWLRLWAYMNRKQEFWLRYFMGIEAEVRPVVTEKLTENELNLFQQSAHY